MKNKEQQSARLQRPCEQDCRKCGSININQKFFDVGVDTNGIMPNQKSSSDFVNREDRYYQPAKKECLVNTCRNCGFSWDSATLR